MTEKRQKMKFKDVPIGKMFITQEGLYQKTGKDKVFYFNGHTENKCTKSELEKEVLVIIND